MKENIRMKWDAKGYTNNFGFVHQYGENVLELLEIKQGMRVAQSINIWKLDDSTALCTIVEMPKSGVCEVCFQLQKNTALQ